MFVFWVNSLLIYLFISGIAAFVTSFTKTKRGACPDSPKFFCFDGCLKKINYPSTSLAITTF